MVLDAARALYEPSLWQMRFHRCKADEVFGAGSAGPGKTAALIMDPIIGQIAVEHARVTREKALLSMFDQETQRLIIENPLQRGESVGWALYIRRKTTMLPDTIARTHRLFTAVDPGARFEAQHAIWHFSSGYRYEFGHCNEKSDWQRYLGREFSTVLYDELIQFEETQFEQINMRLRSSDTVLGSMLQIKAASNPVQPLSEEFVSVKNPLWVRKRYVDPCPDGNKTIVEELRGSDGKVRRATRIYLPAKLHDHPDKEYVERYEFRLLQARPHIRQALLYGNWYQTANSFFGDDWNPHLHTCKPFRVPDDWPQFRSMDWGFKAPGCIHWYAMDDDGNLYVTRELTFQNKTAEEVAKLGLEIEESLGLVKRERSLITGPADTQIWERRGNMGKSIAQSFADKGLPWVKADKGPNSRVLGAERISSRMRDHDSGTATPGIVFFQCCPKAIETMPSIQTDPNNINVPMDGGADHWFDSVRYGVDYASRGKIGVTIIANKDSHGIPEDDPYETAGDRGRDGYGSAL